MLYICSIIKKDNIMIELTVGQIIISIILIWVSGVSIGAAIAVNLYVKRVEKIVDKINSEVLNL